MIADPESIEALAALNRRLRNIRTIARLCARSPGVDADGAYALQGISESIEQLEEQLDAIVAEPRQ